MFENIRVLMITSEYPTEDRPQAVPFIERQVEFLRQAGIDIDLFHFKGKKNLFNYINAWKRLRQHTAGKSYDLVHAQWGQSAVLALPKRLPWVITFRGNDLEGIVGKGGRYTMLGRVQTTVSKLMSYLAEEKIVVSESLAKHLHGKDFHVIPSGLDLELFRPIPQKDAREVLDLPTDKHLILFAASTIGNPRKRYDLANAAVGLIKQRFNAELIVATNVLHSKIPYYMNACDALLLTSLHEGSPNVVKEALACNLPVVSVAVGDVGSRISNIEGCAICENDSPEKIAETLTFVLERGRQINGRESVLNLNEEIICRKVIAVYKMALIKSKLKKRFFRAGVKNNKTAIRI